MGAVTYPDATVSSILNEQFVPMQVNIEKVAPLAEKFQALWTPNLNFINQKEKVFYHSIGWLSPAELAAMLKLVLGHYHLHAKRFDEAGSRFSEVFEFYPHSEFAPEALYYLGAARYLASHDAAHLVEGWKKCQRTYPDSAWARRSMVL